MEVLLRKKMGWLVSVDLGREVWKAACACDFGVSLGRPSGCRRLAAPVLGGGAPLSPAQHLWESGAFSAANLAIWLQIMLFCRILVSPAVALKM